MPNALGESDDCSKSDNGPPFDGDRPAIGTADLDLRLVAELVVVALGPGRDDRRRGVGLLGELVDPLVDEGAATLLGKIEPVRVPDRVALLQPGQGRADLAGCDVGRLALVQQRLPVLELLLGGAAVDGRHR